MNVRAMRGAWRQCGLTLIELVVALTIVAILVTVAVGGFGGMFARKRLEGVAAEIATHLQQARSEAVARNVPVRVTFINNCLVVHTWPVGAAAPTCPGGVVTSAAPVTVIAPVVRVASDVTVTLEPTATPLSAYQFDWTNGLMTTEPAGLVGHGVVVGSAAGPWQLRVRVSPVGRVEVCTPNGLAGYAAC